MSLRNSALAALVSAIAATAMAQDLGSSVTRITRELRGTVDIKRQEAEGITLFSVTPGQTQPPPEPPPLQVVTAGVERVRASEGQATTLPFSYAYTTSSRKWNFRLESQYGRDISAGKRLEGFGGLTALATYVLNAGKRDDGTAYQLLGTFGLGIPTRGERGGDHYSQQVRVIAIGARDKWTGVLAGIVAHVNGAPSGAGDWARVIHGEVHYDFTGKDTGILKLERTHVRGAGGSNSATLEYDRQFTKSWGIEALVTRRFEGATATSVGFNVNYSF